MVRLLIPACIVAPLLIAINPVEAQEVRRIAELAPTADAPANAEGEIKLRTRPNRVRFIADVLIPINNTIGIGATTELTLQIRRGTTMIASCTLRNCPDPAEPPPAGFRLYSVFKQSRDGGPVEDECGTCNVEMPSVMVGDTCRVRIAGQTTNRLTGTFQ